MDLKSYQLTIFTTMFLGYACYAYNRKSVSFALPELMEEGLRKDQAGVFWFSCDLLDTVMSKAAMQATHESALLSLLA